MPQFKPMDSISFSKKVNATLFVCSIALLFILYKLMSLTFFEKEKAAIVATNLKEKSSVVAPYRGAIIDSTGSILAGAKPTYVAKIRYSDIWKIPKIKNIDSKTIYPRRLYIEKLAALLAECSEFSTTDIEDLIYSKAAIFPHASHVILDQLSEHDFYALGYSSKDFPGLTVDAKPTRYYPHGMLASSLLGYVGIKNSTHQKHTKDHLHNISQFLKNRDGAVTTFLPSNVFSFSEAVTSAKNCSLKLKLNDQLIGKTGIERLCNSEISGTPGLFTYEIFKGGVFKKSLNSPHKVSDGETITVSIDAQLQDHAEKLLIQNESSRDHNFHTIKKNSDHHKPFIQGGAIVAIDPVTFEIKAMASYPRYNPEAFLPQNKSTESRDTWLESLAYRQNIYDGTALLEKEILDGNSINSNIITKSQPLTYSLFLDSILSKKSNIAFAINSVKYTSAATHILDVFFRTLDHLKVEPKELAMRLVNGNISSEQEKLCMNTIALHIKPQNTNQLLLFIDILSLLTLYDDTTSHMTKDLTLKLSDFFALRQEINKIEKTVKSKAYHKFETDYFAKWRETHFSTHLKARRKEEKEAKTYNKPYTFYLAKEKKSQWKKHWKAHRIDYLLRAFLYTSRDSYFVGFESSPLPFSQFEFTRIAYSSLLIKDYKRKRLSSPHLQYTSKTPLLHDIALAFYPKHGYGFTKSHAYQEAVPLGSVFKVFTAYSTLLELDNSAFPKLTDSSPRKRTHNSQAEFGKNARGEKVHRIYKNGALPQSKGPFGKISIEQALEVSSNVYFSLLAADHISKPINLARTAKKLGFGALSPLNLQGETAGHVPHDILNNQTGLYAFSIGQHTLTVTPLQVGIALSSIISNSQGQHSILHKENQTNSKNDIKPQLKQILNGMRKVVNGKKGTARRQAIKLLLEDDRLRKTYIKMKKNVIGKTGTAEIAYRDNIEKELSSKKHNHAWFAGAHFGSQNDTIDYSDPKLVVIVYLRYGGYGKEAAPLALSMMDAYNTISEKHD